MQQNSKSTIPHFIPNKVLEISTENASLPSRKKPGRKRNYLVLDDNNEENEDEQDDLEEDDQNTVVVIKSFEIACVVNDSGSSSNVLKYAFKDGNTKQAKHVQLSTKEEIVLIESFAKKVDTVRGKRSFFKKQGVQDSVGPKKANSYK